MIQKPSPSQGQGQGVAICLERLGSVWSRTASSADSTKNFPKGPQPRNTLSRTTFAAGPAVDRKTAPNQRGRVQHALAVEIHKGCNVSSTSNTNERDETLTTPPSAKRRYLDRRASPASSDQTDPLDHIPPHAISFQTSQETSQTHSRAPSTSADNQISSRPMKRNGSFEYRNVEQMMDSRPQSKRLRYNDNRNYPADHALLPSSPTKCSSMSNPIDISGDETHPPIASSNEAVASVHRSTAGQELPKINGNKPNISKSLKERASATHSPYFDKPSTNRANDNLKQKSSNGTSTNKSSPSLAQKFVAADGTRRGSDVNASSDMDELQSAPTTVGENADPDAVFSTKSLRSSSPSKHSSSAIKTTSPTDDLAILAPSIIKSDFSSSNAKSRKLGRPTRSAPREQEADPPWSVALAAISLPGKLFKDEDLGLVYDQKLGEYFIQRRGSAIRTTHSSLTIQPWKLNKIIWESQGKVRLESSRNGMEDNLLDLQLTSERDLTVLLKRLQTSGSPTVVSKTGYVICMPKRAFFHVLNPRYLHRETMQKIFDKRTSELRNLHSLTKSYQNEDISTYSRQRNDSSNVSTPPDAELASRRRKNPSIIDELLKNSTHDTEKALERPEKRVPAMPNGLPEETDIKRILAKLRPTHNEHLGLRRSTRNSGAQDDEGLLSSLDAVPKQEKYSVKHGLGERWKKPLTYPKVGKKKITVEWSDLERLDEGEFLNDNLIGFFLRYLEQRLEEERPELAKRVYFFNTYFFATLTNAHKGRKLFNYEGVQKWTRSVDLFTYDYIIVPINEQAHWYLAIICNLPALDRDLAIHEDGPNLPVEDDHNISKRGPMQTEKRALSATDQPTCMEPTPISEKPNERETRDSFSQLSLENDVRSSVGKELGISKPPDTGEARPASEDKEMLDSQIEDTMPEFAVSNHVEGHPEFVKEQGEEAEGLIEDPGESPKATAKFKKSKRKSLPAPITKVDPRKPAIITFDSLGQPRGSTIRMLKDYLREEAKAKRGMEFEESHIKGINAKRIPQQDNYSDCGVFLLGYVDTFLGLETDPKDFITKTIQQTHEEKEWSKLVPGNLRANIRRQLQELHEIQTSERKEESAKKPGKVAEQDDQKLESSPSRAPDQAKTAHKEFSKADGPDKVPATRNRAPDQSVLDFSRTEKEALETARRLEEEFDKEDDKLEALLRTNEQEMAKTAEYQRLYNPDDDELGSDDAEAPPLARVDQSVIMIDSQSQPRASIPTSVVQPSLSSGKQSYPESSSSRIVNPTSLSFEREKSPELPSEIPDSQSSNTSRKLVKLPPAVNAKPGSLPGSCSIISSSHQRLSDSQSERHERSKRRKTGREDRVDIPEAPEKQDMVFTIKTPPEKLVEPKESSKRRKRSAAKEEPVNLEEVQIHVIDD